MEMFIITNIYALPRHFFILVPIVRVGQDLPLEQVYILFQGLEERYINSFENIFTVISYLAQL